VAGGHEGSRLGEDFLDILESNNRTGRRYNTVRAECVTTILDFEKRASLAMKRCESRQILV